MTQQPVQMPFLTADTEPEEDEGFEYVEPTPLTGTFLEDAAFNYYPGRVQETKPDPLVASMAKSLETIAQSFGTNAELEDERNTLREEVADLHDKYAGLFGLVADVEKLVSKSTSKLALSVRDAIHNWKSGDGPEPETVELAPEIVAANAVIVSTYVEPDAPRPANDAPVEEWRAFAATFELAEGINLEQLNRSQIRSVLGISQTNADG